MHKFKFGDIVRHKETGAVFVVSDLEEDDGFIAAMGKDDAIVYSIDKTQLELIPHPDTLRLNWIEDAMRSNKHIYIGYDNNDDRFFLGDGTEQDFIGYKSLGDAISKKIIDSKQQDKIIEDEGNNGNL